MRTPAFAAALAAGILAAGARTAGSDAAPRCAAVPQPAGGRVAFFASRLGVPPDLALAVVIQESNWEPRAISHKGARGLMQVMPTTAIQYDLDPGRLLDFDYGAYAGLLILRDLLDRFDRRPELALAGYYAGPEFWRRRYPVAVQRDIERYVTQVLARRRCFR